MNSKEKNDNKIIIQFKFEKIISMIKHKLQQRKENINNPNSFRIIFSI
jgi:hypothetical protein